MLALLLLAAAETVIRAGAVVDGTGAPPKRNQVIVIKGERIQAVGDAASVRVPAGAEVLDLSAHTVLPGLIDAHTHVFLQGEDQAEGGYDGNILQQGLAYRAARATVAARRALEQGFTTLRDLGTEGAGYGDVGIKQAIERGYVPGPRMFVVTLGISTTGGYPLEGYAPELLLPKGVAIVDGPVEARKVAREQIDKGADWIKVYMTHRSWVDRDDRLQSQPTLTVEELRAIVDEAHGQARKVACHAYGGEGLRRALEGGCDSIEHGLDLDEAAVQRMTRQGTWYCPTLGVYYSDWAPEGTSAGRRDRARARPRALLQEGPRRRREDRLRHRHRRVALDTPDGRGVPAHDRARHDPDGRHRVDHLAPRRHAGGEGRAGRARQWRLRRRDRGRGRSPRGRDRAGPSGVRDEGRRHRQGRAPLTRRLDSA